MATTKSSRSQLLVASGGLEIITIELDEGETVTLVPPETEAGPRALTEVFHVLSGLLTFSEARQAPALQPGDTLVAESLSEPVNLFAEQAVQLLYISSQPVFDDMRRSVDELMRLAIEVEEKDGYTADHCLRLQRLADATGRELGLPDQDLFLLWYGAYLHDVGKVRVPLEILLKPGKLTPAEYEVVKQHPIHGRQLLDPTLMHQAGPIVEQHHERLDGSGYPYGFAGDEILTGSYIVAVADTYDAMTTDRPYRKALPQEVAFGELRRFAGIHYPKEIVAAFFAAVRKVEPTTG